MPFDFKDLLFDINYDKETDSFRVACRVRDTDKNYVGEIYATRIKKQNVQNVYYTYNGKVIAVCGVQTNKEVTHSCQAFLVAFLCNEDVIKIEENVS